MYTTLTVIAACRGAAECYGSCCQVRDVRKVGRNCGRREREEEQHEVVYVLARHRDWCGLLLKDQDDPGLRVVNKFFF